MSQTRRTRTGLAGSVPALPRPLFRAVTVSAVLTLGLVLGALASRALAGAPEDVLAAVAAQDRGEFPEAIRLYTKALNARTESGPALTPEMRVAALNNRGNLLYTTGQNERALLDFEQLLRLQPTYATYYNRGNVYSDMGQHELALADFSQAIRLKPDFAEGYGNRAFANLALGRLAQAKADAKRARELNSGVKTPVF